MKQGLWFTTFLLFCTVSLFGQSPERPKKEIPLITEVISKLKKAEGWMLQNNGEWISAQNKIPFRDYKSNRRKTGKYNLGKENFTELTVRTIIVSNVVYSIILVYFQGGNYEFPVLLENWKTYKAVTYYVFKEYKWNWIFPDSVVFNKPYAVNTDIICNGTIIDFNEKSYLFDIENHIRQTLYQQDESTTNLIVAAYPVKIRDKEFFRFKFYETINKPEIYIKYLLEYNWGKLFRNFYFEIDFSIFKEFVNKIGVIDPNKLNDPTYYLYFLNNGISKFENEEYKSALQSFTKATYVYPPDTAMISILLWRGKAKLNLNSFGGALADFDSAIVQTPTTDTEKQDWLAAHYERGNAHHAMHEYLKACEDWSYALQNGYGEAYQKIKKECGKASNEMTININIEKSEKYYSRAMKMYRKSEYLKALLLFEKSWKNNPISLDFTTPYYIGMCRYNLRDYVRSIDEFDHAADLAPDEFSNVYDDWLDVFVRRGKSWQKIGFNQYACEDWKFAEKSGNPNATELLENFCWEFNFQSTTTTQGNAISIDEGINDYETGNYEDALLTLNDLIQNSSGDSNILLYTYRGSTRHKLKDYNGAIEDFNKAIEIGVGNQQYLDEWLNAFFNRGVSKYFLGDTVGACQDWKKAIELGLNNVSALENISIFCDD